MQRFLASALPVRLLSALGCCVLTAGQGWATPVQPPPSLNDPAASSLWPRIFYTAEQRMGIENARRPEAAALGDAASDSGAPLSTYRLDGVSQGRRSATAWINGQPVRQGQEHEGRIVYVAKGAVRLQQAGEPDIVLRPGQESGDAGAAPQDVVPAGSIRRRPNR